MEIGGFSFVLGLAARVLAPSSKLATARGLHQQTASTSLGFVLGLDTVEEDELYEAMDWLLARQTRLEGQLAKRQLQQGSVVLYDVTSTPKLCPFGALGVG